MSEPLITPLEGVKALVKRFGGHKHLQSAAASMGLKISYSAISVWITDDAMPEYIYQALRTIMVEDKLSVASGGFIEFYLRGQGIGKFYLHKDISAVIRKRRK